MKAVFCDALKGSWPNWAKFKGYDITRIYIGGEEKKADGSSRLLELVSGIKSQGFEAGIYRDPSWGDLTAVQLAQKAHQDLTAAGCPTTQPCSYMFDVEYHNPQYVIDLLTEWRKPRPFRDTQWTFEPFQGGWFSDAMVAKVQADTRLILLPQTYLGKPEMYPCAPDAVKQDITVRGLTRVELFYDGQLGAPVGFQGAIFTDVRLP